MSQVYTQKIQQTGKGLMVINMVDGHPDPCSDCWEPCRRCSKKPKAKTVTALAGEDCGILDRVDWGSI